MADVSSFEAIRIGIASPEEIRQWSYGEVKKPETINYRTFKPERDGLFCERIFGPVKDWECHCGRYKKVKFKGIICDRCGVEVTRSKVRRERMGHIELAAPVCHIWYLKGVPSPLSLILDISPRPLEKVLYFASYVITHVDRRKVNDEMESIKHCVDLEVEQIERETRELIDGLDDQYAKRLEDEIELFANPPEPEEDELEEVEEQTAEAEEPRVPPTPEEVEAERVRLAERFEKEKVQVREREDRNSKERIQEIHDAVKLLETVEKRQLIPEEQYRSLEKLLEVLNRRTTKDTALWVRAGLGAAAVKELLEEIDLEKLARELRQEIAQTQGPRRLRAIKRLEICEAFIKSKARPEWMIMGVVPVIPPELRPMVQLDGGRFATSDLNDLYRRIINRNNRLKKIVEIRAPESIVNHEKRLLQEAVDALIDNGRRTRPVVGSNNRPLRSLSDMLKGKEGRFRKNLLGKRVDYSGRSVIVVGPHLKLHQCGLPREMALELFKPFVMKMLVETAATSNIKTAKRMIDRMNPLVWDALERVISEHPVLLNRAPTLHRLGIQAFEPVLVDGKAIQVHPLVCHAFNADFDGDQMAVHVPLSEVAQAEARILMLSTQNLFSPAHGGPIVAPVQDIVLGMYYLTEVKPGSKGEDPWFTLSEEERTTHPELAGLVFGSPEEAIHAHSTEQIYLLAPIRVRVNYVSDDGDLAHRVIETTVGRLYLNQILPPRMRYRPAYVDKTMVKGDLSKMISDCYQKYGSQRTIQLLDDVKDLGFRFSAVSGITISMTDMAIPARREQIINDAERAVEKANRSFHRGALTAEERRQQVLRYWNTAATEVGNAIMDGIDRYNPLFMVVNSGARGSKRQISQLSGMRGLMSDPFGRLIEDLPIKANFHEGLSVLEFFVSTHGARKGLADTALRTADAGYLTRRLVDVAQDVIVRDHDCGTPNGIYVSAIQESRDQLLERLADRIRGRCGLEDIFHPETGEQLATANDEISDTAAEAIEQAGIKDVGIRSPHTCELRAGICARCYGRDLARGGLVEVGTAVGIIAAQSIGEPGTQLTMRTFHTGGVAQEYLTGVAEVKKKKQETLKLIHRDVEEGIVDFGEETGERERVKAIQAVLKVLEEQVRGLLRVVELFEARKPKGEAIISRVDGQVVEIERKGLRQVVLHTEESIEEPSRIVNEVAAEDIVAPETGNVLVKAGENITEKIFRQTRDAGFLHVKLRKSYMVPYRGNLEVQVGQMLRAGDRLTEGPLDPRQVLDLQGVRGVQEYLVREIQAVYKNQGVDINDKHVEIIVRQMLKKRKIVHPGDTRFLPGQVVDKFEFEDENQRIINAGGTAATAEWMLLGITEASLQTESFLSAASFQKTTRVLTEAAVRGKRDHLQGLKENVIIGRLIPAGTGLPRYRNLDVAVETEDGTYEAVKPLPRQMTLHDVEVGREELSPVDLRELASPGPLPAIEALTAGDGNGAGDDADDGDAVAGGLGFAGLPGFQVTDAEGNPEAAATEEDV
jgi:DNA-directed RNA polymerase subunit beta'